ncbi:MAG TPA: DNA adenine methylase [Burkholderiales bacterium]|nr:DNA adenine methylase [Burkholderiales bacterium]
MNAPAHPALRYHGGKFRLAAWIQTFFPAHNCYVEPFGGAAGVLLQKPRAYAEVYNDLDGEIVNFFRVLREPESRARLIEAIELTPYCRDEFEAAWLETEDPVERARRLAIRASMGFGSAGATKGRTGFRTDTRRTYGTAQHVWVKYPAGLATVGERFAGVLVENCDALKVMRQHDGPLTLHYVDPPYVFSTRMRAAAHRYYRHELSDDQHVQLLDTLATLQGMVVLSGYPSDLYDEALKGWQRHTTKSRIASGRGTALRTEVAWLNPACSAALAAQGQGRLIA